MYQHICPHCQEATVSNLAVRWSSRGSPAKCGACGQLSHVTASTPSGIWVTGLILLVAAGFAALATQSLGVGLAGLGLVIAHNVWVWRRAELWPIDAACAEKANKVGWLAALVAWLAALFVH